MIVGGHKCGTTSLKEYLSAHPDVVAHPQQEFTGFSSQGYSELRQAEQLSKLLSAAGDRLALAKHAGLYSDPFGLDRLTEASPGCKVLFILRDPVARARSAFRMESLMGEAQEPFEEVIERAIKMDREGEADWRVQVYLHMGCYGKWLGEILDRFSEDSVRVEFQEEFKDDPEAAYEGQCLWLGLDPEFRPDLSVRHNAGASARSAVAARAMKRLRSERNPVKRAARGVLPERAYLRLAATIKNANRVERSDEVGTVAVDDLLRDYFEEDGNALSRRLSRELPWRAARSVP